MNDLEDRITEALTERAVSPESVRCHRRQPDDPRTAGVDLDVGRIARRDHPGRRWRASVVDRGRPEFNAGGGTAGPQVGARAGRVADG